MVRPSRMQQSSAEARRLGTDAMRSTADARLIDPYGRTGARSDMLERLREDPGNRTLEVAARAPMGSPGDRAAHRRTSRAKKPSGAKKRMFARDCQRDGGCSACRGASKPKSAHSDEGAEAVARAWALLDLQDDRGRSFPTLRSSGRARGSLATGRHRGLANEPKVSTPW